MHIRVSAVSDVGTARESNEDMVLIGKKLVRDASICGAIELQKDSPPFVVAVADGMGGANAGEIASQLVLEQLSQGVTAIPPSLQDDELKHCLEELCATIHVRLMAESLDDEFRRGMGATLVALIAYECRLVFVSAGDSRLYRFRDGILRQLTEDHSLRKLVSSAEAPGNVIFNSFGGGSEFFIDFGLATGVLLDGDAFLLCSDGLTDALSDSEIELMMETSDREAGLLKAALSKCAQDNVSYALVELSGID